MSPVAAMADTTPGNAPPPINGLLAAKSLVAPQQFAKPSTPSPSPTSHITHPEPTSSVANYGHPSPQLSQAKSPTPGQGAPKNGVGAGPVPAGANEAALEKSGGVSHLPEHMNGITHRNGDAAGHPPATVNGTNPAPWTRGGNTAVSPEAGNAPPFKGLNYPLRSSPQLTPEIVHRQNLAQSPQYVAQYEQLTAMIQETSPDLVQVVAREQFAKCILGSDYHVAFIVSPLPAVRDGGIQRRQREDVATFSVISLRRRAADPSLVECHHVQGGPQCLEQSLPRVRRRYGSCVQGRHHQPSETTGCRRNSGSDLCQGKQ